MEKRGGSHAHYALSAAGLETEVIAVSQRPRRGARTIDQAAFVTDYAERIDDITVGGSKNPVGVRDDNSPAPIRWE
jgi:predicted transcriptional regulator